MPYIVESSRKALANGDRPANPGELNYTFTLAISKYIDERGLSYSAINDVVGALEGAKLEFYRRVAVPYEEEKIKANGDVY